MARASSGTRPSGWRRAARCWWALAIFAIGAVAAQEGPPGEPVASEQATSADVEAARAILAQSLPPGASKIDEIRLLAAQDRAARTIGSGGLRLPILRRLVELTRGTPAMSLYMPYLWREEWRSGNQQRAFEIGQELLEASASSSPGNRSTLEAQLASDYLAVGQPARAAEALAKAQALFDQYAALPNPSRLARVQAILQQQQAEYLLYEGRYTESEARLRDAEVSVTRAIEESRNGHEAEGELSIYQSDLSYERSIFGLHSRMLSLIGRYVEAEVVVREGLQRSIAENVHGAPLGEWYSRLATIKLARRQYDAALGAAAEALTLYQAGGLNASSQNVLGARNARLEALIGAQRWAEAHEEYAGMLAATGDDPVARRAFSSPLTEALLLARIGQADSAYQIIDRSVTYRRRIFGDQNPRTTEARAVRAITLQVKGDTGSALSAYHELFGVLFAEESRYVDTVTRGLRGFYLPLAMESYLELVAAQSQRGSVDGEVISDAFMVTDRLRDSRVQQAIVDSAARALVDGNEGLHSALRAEQDASNALRTSFETLVLRDGELGEARAAYKKIQDAGGDTRELGTRIKALQDELQGLRDKIHAQERDQATARAALVSRYPDYHRLVNPRPVQPRDIARRLGPDEALVSVYSGAEHTFTFAMTARSAAQLSVAAVGSDALARDVAHLRTAFDVSGKSAPAAFDGAASYRVYHALVEPVVAALGPVRLVTFAVSGALGQLPMAVLVTEPPDPTKRPTWLIERFALAHVASAAAWASVHEAAGHREGSQPFIGFGAPSFGTAALAPLPETEAEILAMAHALGADPKSTTYFAGSATRSAVLAAPLADQRVVAFSTHGLRPGDLPSLSQPALALAAEAGASPSLLTLDDVLRLKLAAGLVVLSACNTGGSDGLSAEAISGLGRGFFFAGSKLILLTHWEVESLSAQRLMSDFFVRAAQAGVNRAQALREAQLTMAVGDSAGPYQHPFFWAPYALVGDASPQH